MSWFRRGARVPVARDPLIDAAQRELEVVNGATEGSRAEAPWVRQETPGALDPTQLRGEDMTSDSDWPPGCWAASYVGFHKRLVAKAIEINSERASGRQASQAAAGQADVGIAGSLQLLRREVFSLCPLRYLYTGLCFSIILTVCSFIVPFVQGKLVDATIDTRELDFGLIALVGLFMLTGYLCEIFVGILFAVCGHTTVTRLRIKLFRNLTLQDIAFYDHHVSGELSSRLINDSAALSSLTQFTTQTLLGAVVKFMGSLIAMYATHPKLALIATIITPFNTLLVRRTGHTVGHYGVVQNYAMAKANAVAIEVLGSIRTVQSNVGETQEGVRFMDHLNYYLRVIKGTVYLETVLRFTAYGLSRVRDLIVLAYAMHQIIEGSLTIGQYTAFAQYITLYEDGFRNLSDIWVNFKQTITSTGKFVQLLLRRPTISVEGGMELDDCTGLVVFEGVRFAYAGRPDQMVLEEFSLRAAPGDVVALVGESGAGKTTVGRLLLRYYDPSNGRITLDGRDYRELGLWWLRSNIGFVEQEPVLFDRPITDNIAYGSAAGKSVEDVYKAAELANADSFIRELPKAYQTSPGEKASRISGGQKQRVAIARAVIRNPKVLLLDEATSALDSENEHIVQQALNNLMRGKTTFVIAHRLSTIVDATKIMVLHKGCVVEQGSHEELLAQKGKYASFMQHQLVEPLLA